MKTLTNISKICWSGWTKLNNKVNDKFGEQTVNDFCRGFVFGAIVTSALKVVVKTCKIVRKVKGK